MGYFSQFKSGSLLMENREQGHINPDLFGTETRIIDADIISTRHGKAGVIVVACSPEKFYFTNPIFTEVLEKTIEDGKLDELSKCVVCFKPCTSSSGNEYIGFEIIEPDEISKEAQHAAM